MLSSDECSEVAEFAAESPELQDTHVSGSDDSNELSNAESSDSLQLLLYDQKVDSWYSRSEQSACILARWYGANGAQFQWICGQGLFNISSSTL